MASGDQLHIAMRNKDTKAWDQTLAYDEGSEVRYIDNFLYTATSNIPAGTAWVEGSDVLQWIRSPNQVTPWIQSSQYLTGYQVTHLGILWEAAIDIPEGTAFSTNNWNNVVGVLPNTEWSWNGTHLIPSGGAHNLGTGLDNLGAVFSRNYRIYDTTRAVRGVIFGDNSDSGVVAGNTLTTSPCVILNLSAGSDFKVTVNGTTRTTYSEDDDRWDFGDINAREVETTLLRPAAVGISSIGASNLPFDAVHSQEYHFNSSNSSSFAMPLCIGYIEVATAGTVSSRNSTDLSSVRTADGLYNISVSGNMRTALANASRYWYTVTTVGDGDNVMGMTNRSTTGCTVECRDIPNLTFQNTQFIVQVWLFDSSI